MRILAECSISPLDTPISTITYYNYNSDVTYFYETHDIRSCTKVKLLSIPTPARWAMCPAPSSARSRGCVRRCRGRGKGFPGGVRHGETIRVRGGNPFRYVRFAATLLVAYSAKLRSLNRR